MLKIRVVFDVYKEMSQMISKIKDDLQFVFLLSCFLGQPTLYMKMLPSEA